MTPEDIAEAAISVVQALKGTYAVDGRVMPVNGDLSKLRFVPGLHPLAARLLHHVQAVSRPLPGVQETRRTMRFETHAFRVFFGVPLFVTVSQTRSTTCSWSACPGFVEQTPQWCMTRLGDG